MNYELVLLDEANTEKARIGCNWSDFSRQPDGSRVNNKTFAFTAYDSLDRMNWFTSKSIALYSNSGVKLKTLYFPAQAISFAHDMRIVFEPGDLVV